jgi:diadenosine tetraphosphatase ApaH/serine/threonine PP2A family protein phosphatase
MRIAVFADIHANWEALERAATEAERRGLRRTAVLGDVIGYGADPNACLEWVFSHAEFVLRGNHEQALFDPVLLSFFNEAARRAVEWTSEVIDNRYRRLLSDLPYVLISSSAIYTHSSPHEPEKFHYLFGANDAEPSWECMDRDAGFFGHTHVPALFCRETAECRALGPGKVKLQSGRRYLLNPGSVGQPRDRDRRLSFGVWDEEDRTFEIVRLAYDARTAARKIRRQGLPEELADRLL